MRNKEEKEASHERYLKHREQNIARAKAWIENNRKRHNENALRYYYRCEKDGGNYYQRHKKERLAYSKSYSKTTISHNGKVILRNVDKPPKPELCRLCHRKSYLVFHHWEDSKPEIGFWICNPCHLAIHRLIKTGILKPNIESQDIFLLT